MKAIVVHARYPGGNIRVNGIEEQERTVHVEQEIRDSTTWWFYWNFCVEQAQGTTVHFRFDNGEVIGPWGPAVSVDGERWEWLMERGTYDRTSFTYTFGETENRVYFAFCMPYQWADYRRFLQRKDVQAGLRQEVLTRSRQGNEVPLLVLGPDQAKHRMLLTCRHHACESSASYVLEGVMDAFLQDPTAGRLLQDCQVHIVPFVDLDGVEQGDQGKSRAPHDHNRDYIEQPIYPETAAVMEYVRKLQPDVAIDLHAPWKWGGPNDQLFIVKHHTPGKEQQEAFGKLLQAASKDGELIYTGEWDIESDVDWNLSTNRTASKYYRDLEILLCFTFEIPYFGTGETVYTQANLRDFGRSFARALADYLDGIGEKQGR
ncbi:M14-type cytosolic carboxypeptidase [Paenibacillus koleovorans]|uniref:M14-type cytosolic carboxypeptidase n=1 Tax=Paenibacillus koleovorans TaxID=121608 RepID=UPI000FD7060B|nr:M14-type cytosolic carboxypeptidase [Paenibacillus koleovorans]